MRFDLLTENDIGDVNRLQPQGWKNILPYFYIYIEMPFCFPVKVVVEGKVAGIGTAIIMGTTAWLAHIIVNPDLRNSGIGTCPGETSDKNPSGKGMRDHKSYRHRPGISHL